MNYFHIKNEIIRLWREIDKVIFLTSILLIILGTFFIFLNSKYVANQRNWSEMVFVKKHLIFGILSIAIIIFMNFLDETNLMNFLFILFIVTILALLVLPFIGSTAKGARRWISLMGYSIQPSEFLKPTIFVFTSYIIKHEKKMYFIPIYVLIFCVLLRQPDFGMTFIILVSIFCQLFVANIKMKWILIFSGCVLAISILAYCTIPHVHKRVNTFVNSFTHKEKRDKFGIEFQSFKSSEAISSGKLIGKGLGGGIVKKHLPDVHADFIFAGIAEDGGLLLCIIIIIMYFLIMFRIFLLLLKETSERNAISIVGMAASFGLQILINISCNIGIIPPKGVTLPFISYGGSSMISCAILIGVILNLTKKSPYITYLNVHFHKSGIVK